MPSDTNPSRAERVTALSEQKRALYRSLRAEPPQGHVTVLRPGSPGGGEPIVLVHPVGGGLFCYRELARALPSGRPVWGLAADPDAPTLEALAARHLDRLEAAGTGRDALLAGWSLGGVVAYEMARQRVEPGDRPPPVVLVDALPWPESAEPWDQGTTVESFVVDLLRSAGQPAREPVLEPDERRLPPAEALARTARRLAGQGVDLDLPADELTARYRVYAALAGAFARYRPTPYDHRVVLVHGSASPVSAGAWADVVRGPLQAVPLPGDHYSLLRPPTVARVAGVLHDAAAGTRAGV